MRENHQPVNAAAPDANAWRENGAPLHGLVIAPEQGAVQLVGRGPFAIHETVLTVPAEHIIPLVIQLLGAIVAAPAPPAPVP